MAYKKRTTARTALKGRRRAITKRSSRPAAIRDGMRMVCSTYIEVQASQPDNAAQVKGGILGYSIKCDPTALNVELGAQVPPGGLMEVLRMNPALGVAATDPVRMDRFEKFKSLYRQMRVDSVSLKITTDRHCGLDNPVLMLQDSNVSAPCVDINQAYAQAHKSATMTEANRTTYYSYRPTTPQQREFHMIGDGVASEAQYLKILQELEPAVGAICKHRIEATFHITLKDSKTDLPVGVPAP